MDMEKEGGLTLLYWVMTPPTNGPKSIPGADKDITSAVRLGRFSKGAMPAMTVRFPIKMPEDPAPATALPMMNTLDDGATPQMRDPNMKRATYTMRHHCS